MSVCAQSLDAQTGRSGFTRNRPCGDVHRAQLASHIVFLPMILHFSLHVCTRLDHPEARKEHRIASQSLTCRCMESRGLTGHGVGSDSAPWRCHDARPSYVTTMHSHDLACQCRLETTRNGMAFPFWQPTWPLCPICSIGA